MINFLDLSLTIRHKNLGFFENLMSYISSNYPRFDNKSLNLGLFEHFMTYKSLNYKFFVI